MKKPQLLFGFTFSIFVLVVLASSVSATFSFSNYADFKPNEGSKYGTIDVWNGNWILADEKVASYTLIDNTDQCLISCRASGTATLYQDGTLFDKINFYNGLPKEYFITLINGKSYEVEVPDYKEVCKESQATYNICVKEHSKDFCEIGGNLSCSLVQTGTHNETRYMDILYEGEKLKAGVYNWRIDGKISLGNKIDWVGVALKNIELTPWAWWNSSWSYRANITGLTGDISYLNITYNAHMKSDFGDLRFTDIANTYELNYTIESYVASSSAIIRVNNYGTTQIEMYYGNAGASTTSNIAGVYLQPDSYYFLNETAGTSTYDAVNLSLNNGTITGVTLGEGGKFGKGYLFNTATNNVDFGTNLNYSRRFTFSVIAWEKSNVTGYHGVLTKDTGSASQNQYNLNINGGQLQFAVGTTSGLTQYGSGLSDNQWHFIVGTYNMTNTLMYIDGAYVGKLTSGSNLKETSTYLGIRNAGTAFNGTLDEVATYNRTLTQAEITELYNQTAPSFTLGNEESLSNNPMSLTTNLSAPPYATSTTATALNFNSSATVSNGTLVNSTLYVWNSTGGIYNQTTNSITGANTTNQSSWDLTSIPVGDYNWSAYWCAVNDTTTLCVWGNLTTNWTFTISSSVDYPLGLTANLSAPADKSNLTSATINFNSSATVGNGTLMNSTIYIWNITGDIFNQTTNTISGANTTNQSSWTIANFPNGKYNWTTYWCAQNDTTPLCTWGNLTANWTFISDTNGPGMVLNTPLNATYPNPSADIVNVTATDALLNISFCWYNLNGNQTANISMEQSTGNNWINTTNITIYEGTNNVTVYCNDTSNNVNSTIVYLAGDTSLPVVTIAYPLNTTYNVDVNELNYTYSDAGSNTQWCLWNNGTDNSTKVAPGTNWTGLTSNQGTNIWTVWCNDTFAHWGNAVVTFYKDTIAPTNGTDYTPANNTISNNSYVNFTANFSDATGLQNATLTIYNQTGGIANQTTITIGGALSWAGSIIVWLADGIYNWFWEVVDILNNAFTGESRNLTVDTAPVSFVWNTPLNITYPNPSADIINVTVTDVTTNVSICWAVLNGNTSTNISMEQSTGNNWINETNITIVAGTNNVTIYCNDSANNVNSTIIYFAGDNSYPIINWNTPLNQTYINPSADKVNITPVTLVSNISFCWYNLNSNQTANVSMELHTPNWANVTNITITPGTQNVTVYCNNTFNIVNSTTRFFSGDTTWPNVYITWPLAQNYSADQNELNYTANDAMGNGQSCYWRNETDTGAAVTFGNNWSTMSSNEGWNTWRVYCNDSFNNTNLSSTTFFVDTIFPLITIAYPVNGTVYHVEVTDFNYSATDANINLCWYSTNNGGSNTTITCHNLTAMSAPTGFAYNWLVGVNDTSGNSNYSIVHFEVDIPPITRGTWTCTVAKMAPGIVALLMVLLCFCLVYYVEDLGTMIRRLILAFILVALSMVFVSIIAKQVASIC